MPWSVIIDSTVALPLLTAYAMAKTEAAKLKRLYHQREALLGSMKDAASKTGNLKKS